MLEHYGHIGRFVGNYPVRDFEQRSFYTDWDIHKCVVCGIMFVKVSRLTLNYYWVVKWYKEKHYYYWDTIYDYPSPGKLWACNEKDKIIQEVIC